MNKAQIVARMAKDSGLTKADALRALDAFLENVTRSLKKGEKVTLVGFGTFVVGRRRARAGRNPQTGAPIKIPARRVPRFVVGKNLKDTIS
jgi:DNA-binding protein HU-beta